MKITPNVFPYIERIKSESVLEDRILIAIEYIDFTIKQFESAQHQMTGRQLLRFFNSAKEQWAGLVNREFPMSEPDDSGEVDYLAHDMYESLFAQRVLPLADTAEKLELLKEALTEIYIQFGWDTETIEGY